MSFDSIIFDMDGTLWDAVDSYCEVWNATIADLGFDRQPVTRSELASLMGLPLTVIYDRLIGSGYDHEAFMARLGVNEESMMPRLGGVLYPGVKETIARLAQSKRLFMVSNCQASGLPNFLTFTGLEPYFTDHLSYGQTGREKDENICDLVERYGLAKPLYVGDTQGDCRSTHAAGLPFAWAMWGFGRDVEGADYELEHITDLVPLCEG